MAVAQKSNLESIIKVTKQENHGRFTGNDGSDGNLPIADSSQYKQTLL